MRTIDTCSSLANGIGNVVIYNPAGTAIWATNTWVPTGPVAQGDRMLPEDKIGSTRRELEAWIKTPPQPRMIAMEAAIFAGFEDTGSGWRKAKTERMERLRATCLQCSPYSFVQMI